MARQKGMLNLSGNIEVNAGAPFDARDIVPTKADLTVASNFPYAYVGMETYVVAEDKKYRYMGGGVTTLSNWVEVGSGGGTTYNDFVGATDQQNGIHGLVPAPLIADKEKFLKGDGSWAEIPIPNVDLSNEISGYNIYSTTEKMVGQWTDGKPLYQKVIDFGAIPSGAQRNGYVMSSGLSGIERFFIKYCYTTSGAIIPYFREDIGAADGISLVYNAYNNNGTPTISITTDTDRSGFGHLFAVLQYTKIADSTMSIGSANDYSTTEKIVGTWIDGRPLYEKTINIGAVAAGNYGRATLNANADKIVNISGSAYNSPNKQWAPITFPHQALTNIVTATYLETSDEVIVYCGTSFALAECYVTIRYTKTTD